MIALSTSCQRSPRTSTPSRSRNDLDRLTFDNLARRTVELPRTLGRQDIIDRVHAIVGRLGLFPSVRPRGTWEKQWELAEHVVLQSSSPPSSV
jgi:hypothetical protein